MKFGLLSVLRFLEDGKKDDFGWIKAFKENPFEDYSCINSALIGIGIEVEQIQKTLAGFEEVVLQDVRKHPNADSLLVCLANGKTIVCGDQTIKDGDRCILANIGAVIPSTGKALIKSKIRDIESQGMLCSATELLIEGDASGVVKLQPGEDFARKLMPNGPIFDVSITPNRGDFLCLYGIARDLYGFRLGGLFDYHVELKQLKLDDFLAMPSINASKVVVPDFVGSANTANSANENIQSNNSEKVDLSEARGKYVWYAEYVSNDKNSKKSDVKEENTGRNVDKSDSDIEANKTVKPNEDAIKQMYFLRLDNLSGLELPISLKRELFEFGIQPESPIIDICRYVAHCFGQPISVFDADLLGKLSFAKASVDEFEDPKGKKFSLKDVLCMFSDEKCVQVCGVADAKWALPSENTKNVLLQAGNYSRKELSNSENQMYVSDSSKRFSYGIDLEIATFCLQKAAELIALNSKIKPSVAYIECAKKQILEQRIFKTREILSEYWEKNLTRLGFTKVGTVDYCPPSWRNDIIADECLETELMKHEDFDYPDGQSFYPIPLFRNKNALNKTDDDLRIVMCTLGLHEIFTRHFMSKEMNEIFQQESKYYLKNPMNQSQFCLRNSILPSIIEVFSMYKRYNWQAEGVFEIGTIFTQDGEEKALGVGISDNSSWLNSKFSYYNAKSNFETAVTFLYGDDLFCEIFSDVCFVEGCLWKYRGEVVARFGKINPSVQKKVKSKQSFYIGEVFLTRKSKILSNLSKKIALESQNTENSICKHTSVDERGISAKNTFAAQNTTDYEVVTKDLSILMKEGFSTAELLEVIKASIANLPEKADVLAIDLSNALADSEKKEASKETLDAVKNFIMPKSFQKIDVVVFDIYPDAKFSNPERSVGVRLCWLNLEKTLSSYEISLTLSAISDSIEATGCKIRES